MPISAITPDATIVQARLPPLGIGHAYAVLERMIRAIEHSLQAEPDNAQAD